MSTRIQLAEASQESALPEIEREAPTLFHGCDYLELVPDDVTPLGDFEEAAIHYRLSAERAAGRYSDLSSTRGQARRVLASLPPISAVLGLAVAPV